MKNRLPLVSVGIPTYNRPKGLRRTLKCITGQTYKNLEIIVSDNCSPGPETEAIVSEFMAKDSRIQYFRQEKNKGGLFNFKFVLEKATGEYFMWAADDDKWDYKFVEIGIKTLIDNCSFSAWFCTFRTLNGEEQVVRNYLGFSRFTSSKKKLSDIKKYLLEPSILGKANLIYSIFKRIDLENVRKVFGFSDVDGYDMYFNLAFLSRYNLIAIDDILFERTNIRTKDWTFLKEVNKNPKKFEPSFLIVLSRMKGYLKATKGTPYYNTTFLIMIYKLIVAIKNGVTKYIIKRIISYVKAIANGWKKICNAFYERVFGIDPFYRKLLKEKVIKYDRANRTYVREVMGNIFHLNPLDSGISRILAKEGIREKESLDALHKYVTPDMTILDLGANIGFYVVPEAQIVSKGSGKVISIEPAPENIRLLRLNVETNNYGDYVDIYTGAICDRSGTIELELTSASNSNHLAKLYISGTNLGTIEVPAFTFPDFLKHTGITIEQLDFLRMDIEGAEYEILPDIIELLEDKTSFLMFIEFHPHVDERRHIEALKKLESMGFRCLTATKEYPKDGKIMRAYRPNTTIKQLYTEEFFLQMGGIEVFLKKG